jgi:hypothetical protein
LKKNSEIKEEVKHKEKQIITGSVGWKVYKHLFNLDKASIMPIIVLLLFPLSYSTVLITQLGLSKW